MGVLKIFALLFALSLVTPASWAISVSFVRGDFDGDTHLLLGDAIASLSALFSMGLAPECEDAADFNDDGQFNIGDPVGLLSYLFIPGSPPPPMPFPDCSFDPTSDSLSCFFGPLDCQPPSYDSVAVLNGPAELGLGENSIQISFFGEPLETAVPASPDNDGLRLLVADPYELLVAYQSSAAMGVNRILTYYSFDPSPVAEHAVSDGEVVALVALDQGTGYGMVASSTSPGIFLLEFDLYDSSVSPTVVWSWDEALDVTGLAAIDTGDLYFTARDSTGGGGLYRVEWTGGFTTIRDDLLAPSAMTSLIWESEFWIVQTPVGAPAFVEQMDDLGGTYDIRVIPGPTEPTIRGIAASGLSGAVFITLAEQNQILWSEFGSEFEVLFDATDGIQYPVGVATPVLGVP